MVNYRVHRHIVLQCRCYFFIYIFILCIIVFILPSIFIFITGTVYGGLDNPKLTFSGNVKLRAGINQISLLSVAVGLPVSYLLLTLSTFFGGLMTFN